MPGTRLCVLVATALITATASLGAGGLIHCSDITYRVERVGGPARLKTQFDDSQLELLQKLNRVDFDHLARLDRIVRPDMWVEDELAYSPLPRSYPIAELYPKLIVVHQPGQVFGGYEYGRLVRWGPISSGRKTSQTPTGLFHLNWRSGGRHSTIDPHWFMPWYFNFGNTEGLSFHEYALPGRPASHGCVRLLRVDARWLYDWGEAWRLDAARRIILETGTPVLIVGTYDFSALAPWRSLAFLASGVDLPADPVTTIRQY